MPQPMVSIQASDYPRNAGRSEFIKPKKGNILQREMIKDDFCVLLVLKRSTAVDMYIGGCWHKANLFVKL